MSVTEAATTLRMLGRSPASPSRATLRSLLKTLLVTDADDATIPAALYKAAIPLP